MKPIGFSRSVSLCFAFLILVSGMLASAQTEKVLFSFDSSGAGMHPYAGVIVDKSGNLYGTTLQGGAYGYGTVFKLSLVAGVWTEKILHSFNNNGSDGVSPYASLLLDSQGNLYGTTYYGGVGTCTVGQYPGCGTVFKLTPSGAYQIIHSFRAGSDGAFPASPLIRDSTGRFYGTTASGGPGSCTTGYVGCGTVFTMVEVSGRWLEKVLYAFKGTSDGQFPYGPLTLGAGAVYGTTEGGNGPGTVFKVTLTKGGEWVETTVGGINSAVGNLIVDIQGNVYGTTMFGGALGLGAVFKMTPQGQVTELHSFSGPPDGEQPEGGLIRDAKGNLYGTTAYGGDINCNPKAGCGTVFKLDSAGNESVLWSFTGSPDGFEPYAGLVLDAAGSLYGTTVYGGSTGNGTVFQLIP